MTHSAHNPVIHEAVVQGTCNRRNFVIALEAPDLVQKGFTSFVQLHSRRGATGSRVRRCRVMNG